MSKAYIYDVELNNYNEKLKCYTKIQIENVLNIEKYFNSILLYYNSSNTNIIRELNGLDKKNFITMRNNYEKYFSLINNKINLYRRIANKNAKSFEKIDKGFK